MGDFSFVKMKVVVILFAAVFGRNFQFFQNRQNDTEKQNIFHPRAAGHRWLQRIGLQLGIFKTQLEGQHERHVEEFQDLVGQNVPRIIKTIAQFETGDEEFDQKFHELLQTNLVQNGLQNLLGRALGLKPTDEPKTTEPATEEPTTETQRTFTTELYEFSSTENPGVDVVNADGK